jgi:hypothetical protein
MDRRYEVWILETEAYRLSLEPFGAWAFVHNEVYTWNRAVLREINDTLDFLEARYDLRVFAHPDNRQLHRYAGLFGFKFDHSMPRPLDGELYNILRRH